MFDDILKEFSDYLHSHPDITNADEIEIEYLLNVRKIVRFLYSKHESSLERIKTALENS